jgi:hypothetical protein
MCLAFLTLALVTLVLGNHSEQRHKAVHLGVAVTFVALAAIVVLVSVVRSLWLYPLS